MHHVHRPHRRRSQNDHEQAGQEEQDHRHGQLGGQRGSLALGFLHAHFAVFCGGDAQSLAHRRAVFLGLIQRRRDGLDALMAAAFGQIVESLAAVGQIGQFGGGQRQFLGQLGGLGADFGSDLGEGALG